MMRYLPILILLFAPGCSQDTADWDELAYRDDGRIYKSDSEQPFTGIAYDRWKNGQTRLRQPFFDGKKHGWQRSWYENGQKSSVGEWSSGEPIGTWTFWDRDGDESEHNYDN